MNPLSYITLFEKGQTTKWYLFNGKERIEIGKKLPNEYKHLEYHLSEPPEAIIELIMNNTTQMRKIHRAMIENG